MPKRVRQIRPQLEPFSSAALEVLHVLEPVVGRIIGTAVVKFACEKVKVDPTTLQQDQIGLLIAPIESSLTFYDRSTEVKETLLALASRGGGGQP